MANVPCDPHEGAHPGRFILTDLETGTAQTMCAEAYALHCLGIAEEIDRASRGPEERAEADAEAVARLDGAGEQGTRVVRRGTSRSRKAYEARRRAKAAESDDDTDEDEDEAPGPSEEPTEDVSNAAAVGAS